MREASTEHMCPNRTKCPMYPEFKSQNILRIFQRSYCDTAVAWKKCERWKLSNTGQRPPPRMLPTGELLPEA